MKILIVDDEQIVRNGLKYTIDWKKYGMEIIDAVSNGKKALEVCEREVPDIVITDIRMPVIDGLELTKILIGRYPDIQIIILSAYDDLKYAQEAIHAGAAEYILKAELDCDNLVAVLLKMQERIQAKHSESKKIKTLDSYLEQLKENLLIQLLTTTCYEPEIMRKMEELRNNLKKEELILLHIFPEYTANKPAVIEAVKQWMKEYIWLDSSSHHWILLGNTDDQAEDMLKHIQELAGGSVYCSEKFYGFDTVLEKQKEMQPVMELYNFYGKKYAAVLKGEKVKIREINTAAFFMEFMRQMEGNHFEKAEDMTEELFTDFEKEYCSPEEIYKTLSMLCVFLEQHGGIEKNEEKEINIRKWKDLKTLIENSRSYFQELFAEIKENTYHGDGTVSKAILYMQEHLTEEVTLQKVAGEVYCSPQYLSYLFKRVTGKNFSEYMAELRIKKARNLLVTTDFSVTEIAGMVGIGNASYFSKVFAKTTGMSPNKYRKQLTDMK